MAYKKRIILPPRLILTRLRALRSNSAHHNQHPTKQYKSSALLTMAASILLLFMPALHAGSLPNLWDNTRIEKPVLNQLTRLRFLTTTDFAPFNFINENGLLNGYNIDLARAICRELAIEQICQIEAKPWEELVPSLQAGSADALIAGLYPTEEQRKHLSFSHAYLSLPARFAALEHEDAKSLSESENSLVITDQKIGVITDSTHEKLLRSYYPQAKITTYSSHNELYDKLRADEVQLIFGDGMTFSLWLNSDVANNCCRFTGGAYPAPQFLSTGMTIATRKEDALLTGALNSALQSLERKGVLNDLYLRYFPISFY